MAGSLIVDAARFSTDGLDTGVVSLFGRGLGVLLPEGSFLVAKFSVPNCKIKILLIIYQRWAISNCSISNVSWNINETA